MRLTVIHNASKMILLVALLLQGCSGSGDDDDSSGDDDDDNSVVGDGREQEPNDSAGQANSLAPGSAVKGFMSYGDKDYYQFQIPADFSGYKVTLSALDLQGDCFTGVDPNLELLAADGQTMLYWKEDAVANYCPTLSFVPEPGASYFVVVSTAYQGLEGDYTLTLAEGGTGTVSGVVNLTARPAARSVQPDGSSIGAPGGSSIGAPGRNTAPGPIMPGEMMVQLAPGLSPTTLAARLERRFALPARLLQPVMGGAYQLIQVSLPAALTAPERRARTLELIGSARALPGVLAVEPNRLLSPSVKPNDEDFGMQWDFLAYPGLNAVSAWDDFEGSPGTVVAVIDTGYDPTHSDLQGKSTSGYDFISSPENAGDGDGIDPDADDNLGVGHGTHVAGTVGAATDNVTGVAGVGWKTRFMPLRVCGNYGCTEADIIEAIWYAAGFKTNAGDGQSTRRADVINMSLGGGDLCDQAIQSAISGASQRGAIVVAAAGNDNDDAAWNSPGNCADVLTVGASDSKGARAGFSNYGATVDVMAPGAKIYSTWYGGGYKTLDGTSMATPHIAGLAGLLKGINPSFSFETVLDLMTSHGTPVTCGVNDGCGAGLVDAGAVVTDALTRPNDLAQPVIVVQAVDTGSPTKVYNTVTMGASFLLDSLPEGVYRIQAGADTNGNFILNENGDAFGEASSTVTITSRGEDTGGVAILVSAE